MEHYVKSNINPSNMKTALEIAKYLLADSCPECGDFISNLKLQKLLYYAQGVHLAIHDKPLFQEEIVNWEHGPVVPDVYHHYKGNGSNAIPVPTDDEISLDEFTEEEIQVLTDVSEVFGQFSAWKLRDMTHNERPWKETNRQDVIPIKLIKEYFLESVVS